MAIPVTADTPHPGKPVTSGSVTPYTTPVDVNANRMTPLVRVGTQSVVVRWPDSLHADSESLTGLPARLHW